MPESDLLLLTRAAEAAGEIALRHFGAEPKSWDKGDGAGPVSVADIEVNEMLLDVLRPARPDYGWLSEESEDTKNRLSTKRQFVIDPIDGTRAFLEGARDWGHSLAIVEDGRVIVAAAFFPVREQLFSAELGAGANRNGSTIEARKERTISATDVLAARPNLQPGFWKGGTPPPFKRHFRSSLAYRLCAVAEGKFDAMLTLRPSWEWDIAAGSLIVEEALGHATDRRGAPLRFNNPDPRVNGVVAGGAIHAALIDRLA